MDRAARLSQRLGLPGEASAWAAHAAHLRDRMLREAWDEDRETLTGQLDPAGEVDPRLLALPSRRVIPADHPRMIATARAVAGHLSTRPDASLTHRFQLVDNLIGQGRLGEANELYEILCTQVNSLALLGTSDHAALISSGVALTRASNGVRPELAVESWPR
jgi:GH15 family glucan-1,4-alpha-glucosidase